MNKNVIKKTLSIIAHLCLLLILLITGFIVFVYYTQAYYSSKTHIQISIFAALILISCIFSIIKKKPKGIKANFVISSILLSLIFLISIISSLFTVQDRLNKNMKDIGIKLPPSAKPKLVHDVTLGSWVDYYPVHIVISVPKEDLAQIERQLSLRSLIQGQRRIKEEFWKSRPNTEGKFPTYSFLVFSGGGGYCDVLVLSNNPSKAYIYFDIVFE